MIRDQYLCKEADEVLFEKGLVMLQCSQRDGACGLCMLDCHGQALMGLGLSQKDEVSLVKTLLS